MKDLKQNIEKMEKDLAEMRAKLEESNKFKWEYPIGSTCRLCDTNFIGGCFGDSVDLLQYGRYRLSKKYAEHSLERNRVANRLEALVEQIEPDYRVPEIGGRAYYISYRADLSDYTVYLNKHHRTIGLVYMSEKTAEKICDMLNSGEVKL